MTGIKMLFAVLSAPTDHIFSNCRNAPTMKDGQHQSTKCRANRNTAICTNIENSNRTAKRSMLRKIHPTWHCAGRQRWRNNDGAAEVGPKNAQTGS